MFQWSPGTDDHHWCIQTSGEELATVKEFKYLGSTATYYNKLYTELQLRKSQASQAFGRLKDGVWFNKDLTMKIKCAVSSAIVLSTLLNGAESWTVYMTQAHSLNAYMMRHLRQILGVKWWHHIPNQDILMKTSMYQMGRSCRQARQHSAAKANPLFPAQGRTSKRWQAKTPFQRFHQKKPAWQGKGFHQGAETKKLTTDHAGENLYEGSRHRIQWTASSKYYVGTQNGLLLDWVFFAVVLVKLFRNKHDDTEHRYTNLINTDPIVDTIFFFKNLLLYFS